MIDNAEVVNRVRQMEQYMDEVSEAVKNSPNRIKEEKMFCEMINSLKDYMDSGQWLSDYEADERGELPRDLKRGVLSQDGLYNLLDEIRELEEESLKETRSTGKCKRILQSLLKLLQKEKDITP